VISSRLSLCCHCAVAECGDVLVMCWRLPLRGDVLVSLCCRCWSR